MRMRGIVLAVAALGIALTAVNVRADWDQAAYDQAVAAEQEARAAVRALPADGPVEQWRTLDKALSGKILLRVKAEAHMLLTCETMEAAAATVEQIKAKSVNGPNEYVAVVDQWINDADMAPNHPRQVANFHGVFGTELAENKAHPVICCQAWLLGLATPANFDRAITSTEVSGSRADKMTRSLPDEAARLAKLRLRYQATSKLALEAMSSLEFTQQSYVQRVMALYSADSAACRVHLQPVRTALAARLADAKATESDKGTCLQALTRLLASYDALGLER